MLNIFKIADKGIRWRRALRSRGLYGAIKAGLPYVFQPKAVTSSICRNLVSGRSGLEIGGPSSGFKAKGFLPIYPVIAELDNCNFSPNTEWESSLSEGRNFQFDLNKPKGRQYIAEAAGLNMISDKTYDFIISCHTLEHTANPLGTLKEWIRVLKAEGGIVLVLPHKEGASEHRRPVTPLAHLIEDLKNNTQENDLTHLAEVLELTDLDRMTLTFEEFKRRCENNFQNRCMHHHALTTTLVAEMVDYLGLQLLSAESLLPYHSIVSAKKIDVGEKPQNVPFLSRDALWRKKSPFKIDRQET